MDRDVGRDVDREYFLKEPFEESNLRDLFTWQRDRRVDESSFDRGIDGGSGGLRRLEAAR